MKKIIYTLIISLFILTGCTNNKYDEISYTKLSNMLDNNESFILFIGSSTCTHCDSYKITVNKIIDKYKIDIKYIDVSKFSNDEIEKFNEIIDYNGTPTTAFIKDGKEYCGESDNCSYYRIRGNQDYETVVNKLKQKGYIKE